MSNLFSDLPRPSLYAVTFEPPPVSFVLSHSYLHFSRNTVPPSEAELLVETNTFSQEYSFAISFQPLIQHIVLNRAMRSRLPAFDWQLFNGIMIFFRIFSSFGKSSGPPIFYHRGSLSIMAGYTFDKSHLFEQTLRLAHELP